MNKQIKKYKRKVTYTELKEFDFSCKGAAFIEAVAWVNDNGVDVNISNWSEKSISLTWGELKALRKVTNKLLKSKL